MAVLQLFTVPSFDNVSGPAVCPTAWLSYQAKSEALSCGSAVLFRVSSLQCVSMPTVCLCLTFSPKGKDKSPNSTLLWLAQAQAELWTAISTFVWFPAHSGAPNTPSLLSQYCFDIDFSDTQHHHQQQQIRACACLPVQLQLPVNTSNQHQQLCSSPSHSDMLQYLQVMDLHG